jgi:hypothetical protein
MVERLRPTALQKRAFSVMAAIPKKRSAVRFEDFGMHWPKPLMRQRMLSIVIFRDGCAPGSLENHCRMKSVLMRLKRWLNWKFGARCVRSDGKIEVRRRLSDATKFDKHFQ